MKKLIALAVTLASSLVLGSSAAAAGTAVMSLSPASGNYVTGSTLSAGVSENGSSVTVVTVSLTYDASKLQFISASCGGSFPNTVIAASSMPKFTCSVTPGSAAVSGAAQVGSISFKALVAGSTSVSFASDTQIASNGVNVWDGSTTGGTYNVTTPPAPAPVTHHPASTTNSSQVLGSTTATTTTTSTTAPAKKSTPVVTKTAPITVAKASSLSFGFGFVIAALVVLGAVFAVGIYYEKIAMFLKGTTKPLVYKSGKPTAKKAAKTAPKKTRKPAIAAAK